MKLKHAKALARAWQGMVSACGTAVAMAQQPALVMEEPAPLVHAWQVSPQSRGGAAVMDFSKRADARCDWRRPRGGYVFRLESVDNLNAGVVLSPPARP